MNPVPRAVALFISILLGPVILRAVEHGGTVRAADQFIPGATITAHQGSATVTAFTDESGRYSMDLGPGAWDIQVEMFGFTPVHQEITVGDKPTTKNWTIEMPRLAGAGATPAATSSNGSTRRARTARRDASGDRPPFAGRGPGGPGRGNAPPAANGTPSSDATAGNGAPPGSPQRPGFQSAAVTATQAGQQALANAADASPGALLAGLGAGADPDEALLVNGSTSGGLAAASDDEARRQRFAAAGPGANGAGGLGGVNGTGALGLPPGMSAPDGDSLGLGGLGASAINGGFGGPGFGAPGGGPGGGGPGAGGFGGGRGGGRGGGGGFGGPGGRGGRANANARGPFNGQYANFGNRRRRPPAFTGSIFMNLSNSALNAAPFSLNGQTAPKPSSDRANFGANFGGPMVIPKLLNWQRASFYLTYQGTQSRNPFNLVSTVPTLAERGGDFSQLPVTIYNPLTQQPFFNNTIPTAQLNSAALGLLKYIPMPTTSGTVQNYHVVGSVPNNANNFGVRLNAPLSNKDRLTFNEQFQGRSSDSEQLFGFRDPTSGTGLSSALGWSHSFAPRFNNSATLTFSRNTNTTVPYFAYSGDVAATLGITGTSQAPINNGPPNLSFTNFGSLSDSSASSTHNQTYNFTDAVTYVVKRKHNLTFGFLFRRLQMNNLTYQNARGSFAFSGLLTSALSANGQPVPGTGFDFADFLLGLPQSSSLRYGSDSNYFRSWATSWYVQDDYRISRGLSFNLGLRYEYFAPYTELYGHLANLDLSPGFTAAAVVTPGEIGPYSGKLPTSLIRPDTNNYSPRFGFAWRPSQKNSIVLRGGYSIFYSGSPYAQIVTQLASQPPFANTGSFSTSLAAPLTLENGFSAAPSQTITNTYAVNPNYKLAYAQTWVFALQNTFPHGLLVELEYIGTKGTNLSVLEQPNRALPGSSPLTAQQQLQIDNAAGFNYQTSGANSIFNAGQLRVTRRFARGMSANALYTFSKSIDDASSFTGSGGTTVQNINDWNADRGLSTFDQRHRFTLNYLLSSPVGVNGMLRNGGWKTATLAGWTLSGTFTAASGTPLTATVAGNLSNIGGIGAFASSRAEATGLPVTGGNDPYFNLAAFTTPPPGEFGNAGRDTIPGPFQMSLNASLNRAFRFGESRRQLQLRISANNVLNHVEITNFGTVVNSATYGLPTAASATRSVTLLLRFNF